MASTSKPTKSKSKPPPLRLDLNPQTWSLLNPLAEFAAIATSPQSPLVQHTTYEGGVYVTTPDHQQLDFTSLVSNRNFKMDDSACATPPSTVGKLSSSCGEDSDLSSSGNSSSCSWSASLWQRLTQRTSLQFDDISYRGDGVGFPGNEDNSVACQSAGLERGRQTFSNEKNVSALLGSHDLNESESEIPVDLITLETNPLAGKATPWSQFYPGETISRCGIPCRQLLLRDICFPLSGPDEPSTSSTEVDVPPTPEVTRTVLFDLDSAAHALSTMAKRKQEHDKYNRKVKPPKIVKRKGGTRTKKNRNEGIYAKRPMNAFMLFAKRYRLEITKKHPGKDNRAISVILGDQWKSLSYEDRTMYISEAKVLADEHKRIYPDCWKRKRTSKISSTTNRKS